MCAEALGPAKIPIYYNFVNLLMLRHRRLKKKIIYV